MAAAKGRAGVGRNRNTKIKRPVMNPTPVSPWMTVREAAEYLRCSVWEIYNRMKEGRIQRHYDGGRILVLRSEIEACVQPSPEPRRRRGRPISRRESIIPGGLTGLAN